VRGSSKLRRAIALGLGLAALCGGVAGDLSRAAADEPKDARAATEESAPAPEGSAPASAPAQARAQAQAPASAPARWCASELEALPDDVCAFVPTKESSGPRTLIIFLHGVIQPDTTWQWAQQRGAARAAARHGFAMIAPRGRRGSGPKGMEDWWTWPTAAAAQRALEDVILAEWSAARAALEKRAGKPFERVFVFGFSNGAYYAASLAMRDRFPADGYAVFAGGSGAAYLKQAGKRTKRRAPLYVGWGTKDRDHKNQVKLAKMLREISWPSKAGGKKGVGHAMTDAQVDEAVAFLSRRR
jgi:predicted esterase